MTKTILAVAATLVLLGGCGGSEQVSTPGQSGPQTASLDQLLAPIALYPDPLLAQVLLCASEPAKVTELDTWLKAMQNVKATQLQDAAVKAGFGPSFVTLVLFPQVVARMATDIQWTTLLGQAFATNRSAVFASIQKLRHQAENVGTLKDTPQQDVSTQTTSAGEQVIVIEPANPQVVYVPQYNTTTVYTQAPSTTVVVEKESSADAAVAAGLIGFTAGIAIGAAMNNNYYYGPYGWHGGAYMYNDAWDDYYDRREDARDDWQDHREDLVEDRSDRAEDARENRSDRSGTTQQQRTERQQTRQETRPQSQAQTGQRRTQAQAATTQARTTQRTGSYEARGYSAGSNGQVKERSGASSNAFSGYSSGQSQRSASSRGQQSRSSSRGSGGGGRRR